LTDDRHQKPSATLLSVLLPMFTDGSRLYFCEAGTQVAHVSASGGEVIPVSIPLQYPVVLDISPKGSQLLVASINPQSSDDTNPQSSRDALLWTVPLPGGPPRRLGDIVGRNGTWLPDRSEEHT